VSYRGGAEDELRAGSRAKRVVALADQRRLFSHQGVRELGEDVIVPGGSRQLTREQVTGVEPSSTAASSRPAAAGARGNSPSFGAFRESRRRPNTTMTAAAGDAGTSRPTARVQAG